MKTFRQRFIATIKSLQSHFDLIKKLEDALDVSLPNLCEGPCNILELLEDESGVVWTDEIWDMIYSKNTDPVEIYNEVCALHLENFSLNSSEPSTDIKELFVEQFRVELHLLGAWEDEIEKIVKGLNEEKIDLCIAAHVSPKILAKTIIGS